MKKCPCGSDQTYSECCGIFIEGHQLPSTPELLMRSRYSAYTKANVDYIEHTMKGAAAQDFDKRKAKAWARNLVWLGLKVLNSETTNTHGRVEFIVYFANQGKKQALHEISEFILEEGKWYYIDGKVSSKSDDTFDCK